MTLSDTVLLSGDIVQPDRLSQNLLRLLMRGSVFSRAGFAPGWFRGDVDLVAFMHLIEEAP